MFEAVFVYEFDCLVMWIGSVLGMIVFEWCEFVFDGEIAIAVLVFEQGSEIYYN